MPRKPTQKHPIRDLRKLIGKSQCGFAQTIGINPGKLKRIENNDLALSPKIARRIRLEAGVDDKQLLAGRLRSVWGDKYTLRHHEQWKSRYFQQDEQIAKTEAMKLAPLIDILFRASVKRSRLWQVSEAMIEALNECVEGFDLRPVVDAILVRYKTLSVDKKRGAQWYPWFPQGRGDLFARRWWQEKHRAWVRNYRGRRHERRLKRLRAKPPFPRGIITFTQG